MSRVNERTICLVSHAPFVSGAEIALLNLATGLRAAGHDLLVIVGTRKQLWDQLHEADFRCAHVPMPPPRARTRFGYWNSLRRLRALFRKARPWLIHSNDLPSHQYASSAARGLPAKVLCHHRANFDAPGIAWFNKHGADKHVFVSQGHLRDLTTIAPELLQQRPTVVHDGTNLPPCPTTAERLAAKAALGFSANRRLVLFVGQMTPIKGIDDLLHAWSHLPNEQRAQADLVLVGDDLQQAGAYRRQMESLAQQLGLPVRFVGFQPNVRTWWQAADLAVVPSTVEPFGLVNVEAMAHGIPVVATAVGGIPEIVQHHATGLLVPAHTPVALADALATLLRDPARCATMGHAGRQRCESLFSVSAHVRRMLAVYDEIRVTPKWHAQQPVRV